MSKKVPAASIGCCCFWASICRYILLCCCESSQETPGSYSREWSTARLCQRTGGSRWGPRYSCHFRCCGYCSLCSHAEVCYCSLIPQSRGSRHQWGHWGLSGKRLPRSTNPPLLFPEYTGFRLANNSTVCAGRVEVQVMGTWGTLCASRWDLLDAHVLCRQLGCGFAEAIPKGGHFGRGTGPVWSESFHCDGSEAHLAQCPVTVLGASLCSHEDDAAVICSGCQAPLLSAGLAHPMSLRLVGGGSRCDGRVEIFWHGTWGRVLDDQWDMEEARVVCRQLRCGEAEGAYIPLRAQRGTGPVGLRGVRCAGHEPSLSLCNTSLPEDTGIMEDVGAVSGQAGSRRVRLVDGAGRCAGRVEIYYQGKWGTVCDDAWDLADADVVCRQLSCGRAVEVAGSARFGEGSGQIWLDGVNCSGTEAALWDCHAQAWGQHDCGHKEDAGVVCSGLCWEQSCWPWGGEDGESRACNWGLCPWECLHADILLGLPSEWGVRGCTSRTSPSSAAKGIYWPCF
uniref:SRCR domain-containing protein n=1 Tax=Coturnix japonica TaxID=93934 RepID=A0A8C2TKT2_COTJA